MLQRQASSVMTQKSSLPFPGLTSPTTTAPRPSHLKSFTTLSAREETSQERQTERSARRVGEVQWHPERHALIIQRRIIKLTRTEYQLLSPLRHGQPVTYEELALLVYGCAVDEKVRTMMDKHIDRIRGRLRGSGVYVYCVLRYGYVLLSELEFDEE